VDDPVSGITDGAHRLLMVYDSFVTVAPATRPKTMDKTNAALVSLFFAQGRAVLRAI
jgi:hypothetical protein